MNKAKLSLLAMLLMALAFTISCENQEEKRAKAEAAAAAAAIAAAEAEAEAESARLEAKALALAAAEEARVVDLSEVSGEQIDKAALAASEALVFNPFPSYFKMGYQGNTFYDIDQLIDRNDKQGYGKEFKFLIRQIYRQKEKDMGWLYRFIRSPVYSIPFNKYAANGWDAMVRKLIFAYEDILAGNHFSQIYQIMANQDKHASSVDAYDKILPFVRNKHPEPFILKKGENSYQLQEGEVDKWAVVWAYSFWGRRWHENSGNVEKISSILHNLREYFDCPSKSGTLQTAAAVFLRAEEEGDFMEAAFRLADGEEISLGQGVSVDDLKEGDKVSITYQSEQYFFDFMQCRNDVVLKSLTILPNK